MADAAYLTLRIKAAGTTKVNRSLNTVQKGLRIFKINL